VDRDRPHFVHITSFFNKERPEGPGSTSFIVICGCIKYYKGPHKKKITYRSLLLVEKASLKDWKTQSGPSLSPPSSRRSEMPPSCSEAGTKPLATEQMLRAVADLERRLTMEVKQAPEPFVGFWIGL
jgi:hypothetical protein